MHEVNETALICSRYLAAPEQSVALVTLVGKRGSSYRQPGARMLVLRSGHVVGSISGGCLEGDIAALALRMEAEGECFRLEAVDTRPIFGCYGEIQLFIEIIQSAGKRFENWVKVASASIEERRTFVLATCFEGSSEKLGTRIWQKDTVRSRPDVFAHELGLRERIIIVGSHADVDPLLAAIDLLGWQGIQVLPGSQRTGWVSPNDNVGVVSLSPAALVSHYPPDGATAVVVMTHNIGRDVAYASELLKHDYPYLGMLGSRKRRNEVHEHLLNLGSGVAPESLERLYCPIGLNLGSETPGAIAVSILAEIMATFSGRDANSLKEGTLPIHSRVAFTEKHL